MGSRNSLNLDFVNLGGRALQIRGRADSRGSAGASGRDFRHAGICHKEGMRIIVEGFALGKYGGGRHGG